MTADAEERTTLYFELLDQPAVKWRLALWVGVFLGLFMLAFQPFGVSNYDPNFHINIEFVLTMLVFSAMISMVLAANEFWLRPLLVREPAMHSMLAWLAWIYLLTGSTAFLVYNAFGSFHDFYWQSWLGFVRDVGMVISFPIAGFWFHLRHQVLQSRYVSLKSSAPASSGRLMTFTSDNGKDQLVVSSDDVLFLESEDNYVTVNFIEGEQHRTHLLRSSLKRLEDMMDEPNLVRCHRSFIVNLGRVASCRGNRHGLHLKLRGMSGMVPVSRSYTGTILELLQATPAG